MIDRIQLLMKIYQISAADLADKLGTERSGISHFLSGRNKPSLAFITKLLEKFPDISPDWLIMGSGGMMRTESAVNTSASIVQLKPAEEQVKVPIMNSSIKESNFNNIPEANDENSVKYTVNCSTEKPPHHKIEKQTTLPLNVVTKNEIERIIIFYNDHSFSEYKMR